MGAQPWVSFRGVLPTDISPEQKEQAFSIALSQLLIFENSNERLSNEIINTFRQTARELSINGEALQNAILEVGKHPDEADTLLPHASWLATTLKRILDEPRITPKAAELFHAKAANHFKHFQKKYCIRNIFPERDDKAIRDHIASVICDKVLAQ